MRAEWYPVNVRSFRAAACAPAAETRRQARRDRSSKLDVEREAIFADTVDVSGFRNRHHTGLSKNPRAGPPGRASRRAGSRSTRSSCDPRAAPCSSGEIRHHRNTAGVAERQQVVLDASAQEVVEDLVRSQPGTAACRQAGELFHVVDVEVADSPMANLAVALELLKASSVSSSGTPPRQ